MKNRKLITVIWLILTIGISILTYLNADDNKKIFDTGSIFLLMVGGYGVILTLINHTEVIEQNNKILVEQKKDAIIENTFRLLKLGMMSIYSKQENGPEKLKENKII